MDCRFRVKCRDCNLLGNCNNSELKHGGCCGHLTYWGMKGCGCIIKCIDKCQYAEVPIYSSPSIRNMEKEEDND